MKIAYVITYLDTTQESGILKKVTDHIRMWTEAGHQVKLFMGTSSESLPECMRELDISLLVADNVWSRFWSLFIIVRRVIAWQPDIAFHRYFTYYPALEWLMTRVATVIELNTFDIPEFRLKGPWYRYRYHLVTRERLLRRCRGMVAASDEIADDYRRFEKSMLVLGNGIDLAQYPPSLPPTNPEPRLVFIGSPEYPWHGVDKMILMAELMPRWRFDIVGLTPADAYSHMKDKDRQRSIPPNVYFHGCLNRAHYDSILSHADAAIGSLALHLKDMNEASTLKLREYLAYGLPSIIAYKETDFPEPVAFLLQLPNTPDNVPKHISEIARFVKEWKGKRVPRTAIGHLDVRVKEKRRLEFFQRIIAQGSKRQ